MSKILAQGMITLTQLYEGAQVILTPAAVLIPCDSNETPKPNAYINASTNVKAFLGTMDITSGITLGELEYSDSTVRASKTGTKVSITTITTRTGYVDIPVSATIDGETIDLGKHRFSFVKQIDGQIGQPGAPGDPGFSYALNIKGGTRGVAYAANGTNPEPKTSSQFSVELLKNGVKIANPASISWTCGGNLSGSSSVATFTPTIKSTYNSESSYVKVSVKEFAASLAVEETIPIVCTKHADGLDWINEWNNKYVQVGTEKIITPKIFAGTKNDSNELTGVAIGRDVLGGNANKVIGIVGYKKNTPVFSLDQDANFFVSSSGSAGDVKNGTNNAKGLYFDGNDLYISGKVKISGGSTIGENNTSVEDVINNSNLGAQANNKFSSSGGYNLLKNSKGKNGTAYWLSNGGEISVVGDNTFGTCFKTSAPSGIKHSEAIKLKNNTEYVYEGYIYSKTAIGGSGVVPLHYWCMSTADTAGQSQLTVLDYRQAVPTVDKWTKCYVHFRTASSGDVYFTPFVYVGGNATFDFLVTELSLSESAVESKWTPHPSELYEGSTIIDASGVTVNNGAIKVKNKAGDTVLSGDSNGNLTLSGTIKSEAGNGLYVAVNSGGITFKDSQKNEEVLRIGTSFSNNNRDINGVTFAMPQYSDRISFRHIQKPSLENGWSGSDTVYSFMEMWGTDYNHPNGKNYKGINVFAPMYLSQKIRFRNGGDSYLHEITPNITWNNMNKLMGIYGDNGTIIGYKSGDNLQARIVVTEGNHPNTADVIKSWGHWNCSGAIVHNATFRGAFQNSYTNPVTRTSSETSSIMTEGNQVRVNLENIQIKNGKAILNIPKKYRGINDGYIVSSIVKKGRGDVWVSEEEEERFIIEAENDIKINIEIIIKLTETAVARTLKYEDSICYEVPNEQPEGDCC